jgi:hypothetical protein
MEAIDFYDKMLTEKPALNIIKLMEKYAKHVIEINFCDGSPSDFERLTIAELKRIHKNINMCVDWVNEE